MGAFYKVTDTLIFHSNPESLLALKYFHDVCLPLSRSLGDFNDNASTTHQDVLQFLDDFIAHEESKQ